MRLVFVYWKAEVAAFSLVVLTGQRIPMKIYCP